MSELGYFAMCWVASCYKEQLLMARRSIVRDPMLHDFDMLCLQLL